MKRHTKVGASVGLRWYHAHAPPNVRAPTWRIYAQRRVQTPAPALPRAHSRTCLCALRRDFSLPSAIDEQLHRVARTTLRHTKYSKVSKVFKNIDIFLKKLKLSGLYYNILVLSCALNTLVYCAFTIVSQ